MVQRDGALVAGHEHEGRTADGPVDVQARADALRQRGLSGAQRPLQQHHVACSQQSSQSPAERACTRSGRGGDHDAIGGGHVGSDWVCRRSVDR